MFGFCLSCNVEYNDRFNMLGNRPTDQFTMMGQQLHPTTTTATTTSTATTSGHNHTTSQYRKQQRPRNLCSAWPSFAQRLFPVYYFHNADTQRVKGKCCGGMSGVQAGRWGGRVIGHADALPLCDLHNVLVDNGISCYPPSPPPIRHPTAANLGFHPRVPSLKILTVNLYLATLG